MIVLCCLSKSIDQAKISDFKHPLQSIFFFIQYDLHLWRKLHLYKVIRIFCERFIACNLKTTSITNWLFIRRGKNNGKEWKLILKKYVQKKIIIKSFWQMKRLYIIKFNWLIHISVDYYLITNLNCEGLKTFEENRKTQRKKIRTFNSGDQLLYLFKVSTLIKMPSPIRIWKMQIKAAVHIKCF